MRTRIEATIAILSDPTRWARNGGLCGQTGCIITAPCFAASVEDHGNYDQNTHWNLFDFVGAAVREWCEANGKTYAGIASFNDRQCPDHATLMQVLHRARELELAAMEALDVQ